MTEKLNNPRFPWIDVLRGIAIVLMVPANLGAIWSTPHPLWFRLASSCAAPTFIALSIGMLMLHSTQHTLKYYIERGLMIITYGALVDIIVWQMFPFVTYDILYFIGFSLPFVYIFKNLSPFKLILMSCIIFFITPILQNTIGYHVELLEIPFSDPYWPTMSRILQNIFIDGWFPIFPWLGLAFVGAAFFRVVFATPNKAIPRKLICLSITAIILGLVLLFIPEKLFNNIANNGLVTDRQGYSEIFYPPSVIFMMIATGMVILLAKISQKISHFRFCNVLKLFGKFSLLIYILHQFIQVYVILPILHSDDGKESINNGLIFSLIVLSVFFIIYVVCISIECIKKKYRLPHLLPFAMLLGK